jgi:putative DNA primase/helicase
VPAPSEYPENPSVIAERFINAAASPRGPGDTAYNGNPIEDFRAAMERCGILTKDRIIPDGELYRVHVEGDSPGTKNGWYVLHLDGRPAGTFGCHKRRIQENWKANGGAALTKAELAKFAKASEEAERQRDEDRAKAAALASRRWAAYAPAPTDHPYLARKRVQPHGAKVDDQGNLVIAVLDASGTVQSLQTIDASGVKRFMPGGKTAGGMFAIGELGDRIVIAEGFATAASIHEATGLGVVAAFTCGNLEPVARSIRAEHPTAQIVIAADDDRETADNPGLTKAREAAQAVGGAVAEPGAGGDFNDLFVAEGVDAVAARFAIESKPMSEVQGDFRVQENGVYHKKDRLTSRVDVLGVCRDGQGRSWGRLLAVHTPDGEVHNVVMTSAAMIDSAECVKTLVDRGMELPIGREARDLIVKYICTWQADARVRSVSQIGWHGPAFVLPDRTFGPADETVVLQTSRPVKFRIAGTLDGWRQNVAALAVGNSRLAFGISASFAGPLLHLIGAESGGFHFRGPSSIGKTTALHAPASVWGTEVGSWRTTDNAAESKAAGACDTLLTLDELSQAGKGTVAAMSCRRARRSQRDPALEHRRGDKGRGALLHRLAGRSWR